MLPIGNGPPRPAHCQQSGGTVTLQNRILVGHGNGTGIYRYTPEPTTVTLLAIGILGLLRRRRTR